MIEHLLNFNLFFFAWFVIPAYLVQPLTVLIMIGTAWLGQAVVNRFAESPTDRAIRKALNEEQNTTIKKPQTKDPNKIVGFPIPLPPPKDDDNPDKKNNQDPVADKKNDGKPDPTNDDAPKANFKRILPPNNKPVQQTGTRTPPPTPINVVNPPYFKRTGKFIYQPLEQYVVNFYSMPNVSGDSDFTEVIMAQSASNKYTEYTNFLQDSRISNDTGKYKISDLIAVIKPPGGIIDANPTFIIGTEAIGKMTEAYENYSDGFLSNPIWFVPTEIKVHTIKGIGNKQRRLPPEFDTNFKVINPVIPEILLDQQLFKIPREVTMEQVLQFAGYCATHEGGAEKWEEWKKNPSMLNDPDFFKKWKIPTSDDILNETVDPSAPQYQKQKLKIDSFNEQLLVMAGTMYVKAGLHEFPTLELPGLKNPEPMPEGKGNDQANKSNVGLRIGSLAGAMSYFANWFNFKVGDFPAEIEVPDENNPNQTKKEKVDISGALTNLLAIGGIGLALGNFNKDINLRNAGEIEATKHAAQKSAECSCINMSNSGFNTKPKAQCSQGSMNFTSAKGFADMLKETQRCHNGSENADPATLKAMLENIMFGVNIIKSSFFRGEKELGNQEKVLKDLLKGKGNDDELDEFIKKFNDQQTPITKDYPIKAKIVKRPKGGTP